MKNSLIKVISIFVIVFMLITSSGCGVSTSKFIGDWGSDDLESKSQLESNTYLYSYTFTKNKFTYEEMYYRTSRYDSFMDGRIDDTGFVDYYYYEGTYDIKGKKLILYFNPTLEKRSGLSAEFAKEISDTYSGKSSSEIYSKEYDFKFDGDFLILNEMDYFYKSSSIKLFIDELNKY